MQKTDLSTFSIPANYVLIKPDPDFEFVEVKPENTFEVNGEPVKIWVAYTSETHARHFGITGKVIVTPDRLRFNKQQLNTYLKNVGSYRSPGDQVNISDMMQSSIQHDTEMEVLPGDKVWFHYISQINAVVGHLIIDTEEHGLCFLVKYEDLYCYERNGEVELINGWVWVQRIERDKKTESGLELQLSDKNIFENGRAVIVKAGKPIKEYMDYGFEDQIGFNGGEQVVYDHRFGHDAEYEIHRTLNDKETYSIKRRHIYAVL